MFGRVARAAFAAAVSTTLATPGALGQSTTTYTYDPLGRLREASTPSGATTYTYDLGNNRTRLQMGRNNLPVAVDDEVSVAPGGQVSINLVANDTDADNDVRTIHSVTPNVSPKGTFTPSGTIPAGTTTITYSANASATGQDVLTYRVRDSKGGISLQPGTIRVNIVSSVGAEINATAYTASSNYNSYTGLSSPSRMRDGAFSANNSIHGTNYGSEEWIRADLGSSQAIGQVRAAPIDISHPDGWGRTYLQGAQVQYSSNGSAWTTAGTMTNVQDGVYSSVNLSNVTARYVRLLVNGNYLGVGDFRIFAPGGTTPPPTAPIASNVSQTVAAGSSNNIINLSVTGAYASASVVSNSGPNGGSVSVSGSTIRYTPYSGTTSDSFQYAVTNSGGLTSQPAWAFVTVTQNPGGNRNPVANTDYLTVQHNVYGTTSQSILQNDSDPDGDAISIVSVASRGSHGGAALNGNGTVTYTPDYGWYGVDYVSYTIVDSRGAQATGTIQVTTSPPATNRAPVAGADFVTIPYQTPTNFLVLSNDNDPDQDPLTVVSSDLYVYDNNGTLLGHSWPNPDNTVTFSPKPGFQGGQIMFNYVISDGRGGQATGYIYLTMLPPPAQENRPPNAVTDFVETDANTPVNFHVLYNGDSDPDGDPISLHSVSQPSRGASWTNPNGSVTYSPTPGLYGPDSFLYYVSDGRGGLGVGTIYVTVRSPGGVDP